MKLLWRLREFLTFAKILIVMGAWHHKRKMTMTPQEIRADNERIDQEMRCSRPALLTGSLVSEPCKQGIPNNY